jgi:hypothetical protein
LEKTGAEPPFGLEAVERMRRRTDAAVLADPGDHPDECLAIGFVGPQGVGRLLVVAANAYAQTWGVRGRLDSRYLETEDLAGHHPMLDDDVEACLAQQQTEQLCFRRRRRRHRGLGSDCRSDVTAVELPDVRCIREETGPAGEDRCRIGGVVATDDHMQLGHMLALRPGHGSAQAPHGVVEEQDPTATVVGGEGGASYKARRLRVCDPEAVACDCAELRRGERLAAFGREDGGRLMCHARSRAARVGARRGGFEEPG